MLSNEHMTVALFQLLKTLFPTLTSVVYTCMVPPIVIFYSCLQPCSLSFSFVVFEKREKFTSYAKFIGVVRLRHFANNSAC